MYRFNFVHMFLRERVTGGLYTCGDAFVIRVDTNTGIGQS